jgi:cathepsin F
VGLVLPGEEVVDSVKETGTGPLPHTKKAGAGTHGPRDSTAWTQKELLEQGESRRQLTKLQSLTAFHAFMSEHNRSYTGQEDYKRRYAVFRDNMKKVQFLQETEQGTGEYGATAMADLTETEFKQQFLGWKK